MSNLLNFALGGLTGAMSGWPLQSLPGTSGGVLGTKSNQALTMARTGALAGLENRDGQIGQIGDITSSVNLLQQFATRGTAAESSSGEPLVNLPPSASMPAPKKPAAVATDDHGQSNIVFSDSYADASLIH